MIGALCRSCHHHKKMSYHVSLPQEMIKIKTWTTVSTNSIPFSHIKSKKKVVIQSTLSQGPFVHGSIGYMVICHSLFALSIMFFKVYTSCTMYHSSVPFHRNISSCKYIPFICSHRLVAFMLWIVILWPCRFKFCINICFHT
jgi:hypothetical protein